MMTWLWMTMFVALITISITQMSDSPIKIMILLMIAAMSISMNIHLMSGETWFPMLYLLIFIGGILILMIMLSAVMPNLPMKKENMKSKKWMSTLLVVLTVLMPQQTPQWISQLKISFMDQLTMTLIIFLVLFYFILFNWLVESSKKGVRI